MAGLTFDCPIDHHLADLLSIHLHDALYVMFVLLLKVWLSRVDPLTAFEHNLSVVWIQTVERTLIRLA